MRALRSGAFITLWVSLVVASASVSYGMDAAFNVDQASGQLQIVAHPDDDLYFMNPAIEKSIRADEASWTIFLTAGDAGGPPTYWPTREEGIRAAYAEMAGVPNVWLPFSPLIEGRVLHFLILEGAPKVFLAFLRLPDGNGDGSGNMVTGFESLQMLWELPEGELIHSVDGAHQYTRSELIETLSALIEGIRPRVLRLQDMTGFNGNDHSDHVHGGRFAFEAHLDFSEMRLLRAYRAYNTDMIPINLSLEERARNAVVQTAYQQFDLGAFPNAWNDREVAFSDLQESRASLAWTGPGMPANTCLAVSDFSLPTAALTFAPCAGTDDQIFDLSERQIGILGTCLTSSSPNVPPGRLGFEICADAEWVVFSDGHIRRGENECLGQLAGEPAVIPCTNESRLWKIQAQPGYAASVSPDFSALEFGNDPALYGSLRFGDINADGFEDGCARRANGVYCALSKQDGELDSATLWTTDFADTAGWGLAETGGTLLLDDLNGDGFADLCGRSPLGVECALASPAPGATTFEPATLWTSSFSDVDGGDALESHSSLRLGDVSGDGLADLCGWRAGQIDCLISQATLFGTPTTWLGTSWSTDLGSPPALRGQGMMLGDIDGDGDADLCERGVLGVYCARSEPELMAFENAGPASPNNFTDALGWDDDPAYWGSIRLGDISGDGQADLCGRDEFGVLCVFSIDGRFSVTAHRVSEDFSDLAGFVDVARGSTLALPDLDGDGHAEPCAVGATELICSRLGQPTAVPEPSLAMGLILGCGVLATLRRRHSLAS